jgi:hypothetical protein
VSPDVVEVSLQGEIVNMFKKSIYKSYMYFRNNFYCKICQFSVNTFVKSLLQWVFNLVLFCSLYIARE